MQILKINLKNNENIKYIANILKPYTNKAYLVGGSVRDLLLGLKIQDFDIEVYNINEKDFSNLMQKIGANGVGKSFFVYKFKNYDLALPRYENKISYGHKGFEVKICDNEKDASKRRDFTINALMYNIFSGKLLDFHNGIYDLNNKILRHINDKSFIEDSLRILRAIDFASRFDFKIHNTTMKLMKKMDISDLSKDRINSQMYKIFKNENLYKAYKYIKILNLEEKIFLNSFDDEKFLSLLKNSRKFIKDEALFLYLYLNYFNINIKDFFDKTKFKKDLLNKVKQKFYLNVKQKDLLKISIDIPLNKWLGLWNLKRINLAKKLNIYENKLYIDYSHLIKQGYSGKELGDKIYSYQNEFIKDYLKNKVYLCKNIY